MVVLDLKSKGRWLETDSRHFVVSLGKTLYRLLNRTGSTQEGSKSSRHFAENC